MELTAKCILMNAVKKKSKKENEYIQISLMDNETSEIFTTYYKRYYKSEPFRVKTVMNI